MPNTQIADRVSELTGARTPFVRATVVRAQAPTSVHAGDDAIVLADGTLEGFVGGQCTQNSVRTAALAALSDANATLLRVLPDDADPFPATPGAQVVVNPCHSGGAMEIFLQPVLPPPLLTVTGSTPIAEALRSLAGFLGYTVIDPPAGTTDAAPDVRTVDDLAGCTAVLLASHGPGEAETIRAALAADVGYIGLVASRKRSAALFDELGLDEEQRARIDAPAGQWIGAKTAAEIALSILADVVATVRIGGAGPAMTQESERTLQAGRTQVPIGPATPTLTPMAVPTARQAIDPVCHMTVTVVADTPHLRVDGTDYYFCNPGCRKAFAAEHPGEPAATTTGP